MSSGLAEGGSDDCHCHCGLCLTTPATSTASLTPCPPLQLGFFNVVVLPLFNSLASVFPAVGPMLASVQDNCAMWVEEAALLTSVSAAIMATSSNSPAGEAATPESE